MSPQQGTSAMRTDDNPFSPLATAEHDRGVSTGPTDGPIEERPPPIYIKNVSNINSLLRQIQTVDPGEYTHSSIQNKLKLTFKTIQGYRNVIKYLESTTAEFYTYKIKSEKTFRVVIRGLHATCDASLMMEELRQLGYDPVQMLPVRHPVTKQILPMFFVDLKPSAKNPEIYDLKRLYHAVIKVEPPKPRRTVIQCSRCQEFNHTKNFCRQRPKCVKCDGSHSTDKCPKSPETPPVCVNCKGPHTANYKGCPAHKALQMSHPHLKLLNRRRHDNTPPLVHNAQHPTQTRPTLNTTNQQGRSYADAAKSQNIQPTPDTSLLQKIDSLISLLQPLIGMLTQILPVLLNK